MRHSSIFYFFYADYTIPIMKTYIIFFGGINYGACCVCNLYGNNIRLYFLPVLEINRQD